MLVGGAVLNVFFSHVAGGQCPLHARVRASRGVTITIIAEQQRSVTSACLFILKEGGVHWKRGREKEEEKKEEYTSTSIRDDVITMRHSSKR